MLSLVCLYFKVTLNNLYLTLLFIHLVVPFRDLVFILMKLGSSSNLSVTCRWTRDGPPLLYVTVVCLSDELRLSS